MVKVNKELGQALNKVLGQWRWGRAKIVEYAVKRKYKNDNLKVLHKTDLDLLIKAVYIGYEVVKTQDEEIQELFEAIPEGHEGRLIVHEMLNVLNKKVVGINK